MKQRRFSFKRLPLHTRHSPMMQRSSSTITSKVSRATRVEQAAASKTIIRTRNAGLIAPFSLTMSETARMNIMTSIGVVALTSGPSLEQQVVASSSQTRHSIDGKRRKQVTSSGKKHNTSTRQAKARRNSSVSKSSTSSMSSLTSKGKLQSKAYQEMIREALISRPT